MANTGYKRVYTSFSGADILVSIDNQVLGELQGLSFSITREKAPLYTLGSPDPRAFSRGKRGISGSLIFLVFNRSPLPGGISILSDNRSFIARPNEEAQFINASNLTPASAAFAGGIPELEDNYTSTEAWYADQLPPFDALVRAVNEYGHSAQMEVLGIEILNTGSGFSVDDITIDESHTYVARRIKKWHKQRRFDWAEGQWDHVENDFIEVAY